MSALANLEELQRRVAAAAVASGRDPGSVRVLPVSKTVAAAVIAELYAAGVREFAENREPVLAAKAAALPPDVKWHFIGPLQANKVRKVVRLAQVIHSVDSPELLDRIDRIAGEEGRRPEILLEVNVSGEASKGGCTPEQAPELARRAAACRNLSLIGLMTMAPLDADEPVQRAVFGGLAALRAELQKLTGLPLPELSMGMTRDFVCAVSCGSTIVRLGTAVFGAPEK